jgi:hypothetical protein
MEEGDMHNKLSKMIAEKDKFCKKKKSDQIMLSEKPER